MSALTRIVDQLLRRRNYKYTVYYLPETDSDYVDKQIFKNGIQGCPHYDCDFYRFDLSSGVILCRRRISRLIKTADPITPYQYVDDCNEFAFPAKFFMGAVQHYGLKDKHIEQMENETAVRKEAQNQVDNPRQEVNDVSFS